MNQHAATSSRPALATRPGNTAEPAQGSVNPCHGLCYASVRGPRYRTTCRCSDASDLRQDRPPTTMNNGARYALVPGLRRSAGGWMASHPARRNVTRTEFCGQGFGKRRLAGVGRAAHEQNPDRGHASSLTLLMKEQRAAFIRRLIPVTLNSRLSS